jgi:apolipoprotein D and lipocalin family protein
MFFKAVFATAVLLGSTVSLASDVRAQQDFDVTRYVGKWYEIATFGAIFQTGCNNTTANYSLNNDGTVAVRNECRLFSTGGFKIGSDGIATVPNAEEMSKLKVSFFGSRGSDYWVLYVDGDYQYALVGEPSRKYLWLLSRTPTLPAENFDKLVGIAREQGFDMSRLKLTNQKWE